MQDVFLDTNILIYAASGAGPTRQKHEIAMALLGQPFAISAQILAEFYANATRKGRRPLSPEEATEWVIQLSRKPCPPVTFNLVRDGIDISRRYQVSYWDGAMIAAASSLGCKTIFSEDLSHRQHYDGVEVINPFFDV